MYSQRLAPMEAQMMALAAELEAARQETRELQEQVGGGGAIGKRRMEGWMLGGRRDSRRTKGKTTPFLCFAY